MDIVSLSELSLQERAILAAGLGSYSSLARGPDGRLCCVAHMFYTYAILGDVHGDGYEDQWCYHSELQAVLALRAWSGEDGTEPVGWHRHPMSGRRREHGDPTRETVRE